MTFGVRYVVFFLVMLSVTNVISQVLISQSPKLIKSVLTQAGSSTVSYEYPDASGVFRTTTIQQSIGQHGTVGLSKTPLSSVQQGFLNHIKTIKVDNRSDDFIEIRELSIFPNPFKAHVNIKFSKPTIYPIQIEVFDVRGRLVLNQEFQPSGQITVSMDRLEDASYIIRISSGSSEFLKKLIKGRY